MRPSARPSPGGHARPDIETLRSLVGALDPDALAAAGEVDRSLVRLALSRRPFERIEFARQMLHALSSFRHVGTPRL